MKVIRNSHARMSHGAINAVPLWLLAATVGVPLRVLKGTALNLNCRAGLQSYEYTPICTLQLVVAIVVLRYIRSIASRKNLDV